MLSSIAYEPIRDTIATVHNVNVAKDSTDTSNSAKKKPSFIAMVLAGGSAGAVGASIANPTDVLKVT